MRLFKPKPVIPVSELPIQECANCQYEFRGHFCPNCGQEVAEFDRPFGFMIYDFMGNFFAFDTRFLTSFKYLLFRPGFLTLEFFKGRRARYSPPFRIFVFLSFIMFMLLQMLSDKALEDNTSPNTSKTNLVSDTLVASSKKAIDSTSLKNSLDTNLSAAVDSIDPSTFSLNLNVYDKKSLLEGLEKQASLYERKLLKTQEPGQRKKLQGYITMCRMPGLVISNTLKYLSWAFLILLPLYALILKLFFIRKKRNFIQHFFYSIHLHSFKFFVLIIALLMALLSGGWFMWLIMALLYILSILYQVVALKVFYEIKYRQAIFSFLGIGILYQIMLWSAIVFAVFKSLIL